MKVYISYHSADKKYKKKLEKLLDKLKLEHYSIPEEYLDSASLPSSVIDNIDKCSVAVCLIGRETYCSSHVSCELNEAIRKKMGIMGIILESRKDNKNHIDKETFPEAIIENCTKEVPYAVLIQYATMEEEFLSAFFQAKSNRHLQLEFKQ